MKQVQEVCQQCPVYVGKRKGKSDCLFTEFHVSVALTRISLGLPLDHPQLKIDDVPPECYRVLEHVVLGQEKT